MPVLIPLITNLAISGGGGGVPDVDASYRAHGSVDNVGANSETTVLSITNGGPGDLRLDRISVESSADGVAKVYIDGVLVEQGRLSISTPTQHFVYPRPQLVPLGKIVEVKVVHYETGHLADFSASILGHRI